MRIYLESLGCRLNYAEMAALGRQLAGAGHELAASADQADLCVLNSCAVTGEAARQSRQLARQMARANPAGRLILTGCYATLEGETAAHLPNVALIVGNTRKDELLRIIGESANLQIANQQISKSANQQIGESANQQIGKSANQQIGESRNTQYAIRNTQHAPRTRAFIKVQDGCRNHCTFCIVTVARGDERSRPIAEVVAEVNALHAAGFQEAVLTGVHLGGYGSETGATLQALVAALLAETTIPRLRLSSLEPFDVAADFFDLWGASGGRLMPHLHLPAQSGSDAVLRRMARRNRVAEFEALVAAAHSRIPGLTVTTDLIAGFPGETESDFADTVAFARRVGFAHIHAFSYSAREGTAAARFSRQMLDTPDAAERKRRVRVLAALDIELGQTVRRGFLGQTRPVLWEAPDSGVDTAEGQRTWAGLTDNYLRVVMTAAAGAELRNRITAVRLARLDGDTLWGEGVDA
jgi:threonylcarbamoyladenosine tRNA methylthiotransferase MtaB